MQVFCKYKLSGFFSWGWGGVRYQGMQLLEYEELMLLNYGVGEDFRESLGLQGDPLSPS